MRRSRRLLCVNCEDCVNCDGCWCLLDERDVKNHFSYINDVKHMRNEPLTEKDKKDLQNRIDKAIEFTKKERKRGNNTQPKDILDQQFKNGFTIALAQVEDILKESGE